MNPATLQPPFAQAQPAGRWCQQPLLSLPVGHGTCFVCAESFPWLSHVWRAQEWIRFLSLNNGWTPGGRGGCHVEHFVISILWVPELSEQLFIVSPSIDCAWELPTLWSTSLCFTCLVSQPCPRMHLILSTRVSAGQLYRDKHRSKNAQLVKAVLLLIPVTSQDVYQRILNTQAVNWLVLDNQKWASILRFESWDLQL